jgi:pyruvate/2-oxoglutarate dehydrogenase complex dihydrolipoamide dehydrogenase (E3) component
MGGQAKAERYEAIVIGTGQAGKPLARDLGAAGWRTAVIEREHVGGTCINVGCTPTKTMVASARVAHLARRAADYGVQGCVPRIDLGAVVRRKRRVVESFRDGSRRRLEQTPGVELIFGEAALAGRGAVEVRLRDGGTRRLEAEKIFINTGTRSAAVPIAGIDGVPVLDNASIMEIETLPEHLLVVGGGYIGLEFGQMFRRFGSRVTVVHRQERLLTREDPDVAEAVAEILRQDGIDLLLESSPTRAERGPDGSVRLSVKGPRGESALSGTHLLLAAGRVPDTERLNLESAGVRTDRRGFIQVDERLRTSAEGVYALGDVKGGPAFTHISYDDYRIVRDNLLLKKNATTTGRLVPYTVFIDPQLGRVGLSETEAREQGRRFRVARLPMTHVARAIEMDETRGFMKAIVDADSGQILGCAVLAVEGGEIMSALQVAMMGRLPYTALKEGIFAHPTLAEALNNMFLALDASTG